MKDLISLSLKYIRRQKMRTVLSFLCIMLSVFILNTVSAYFSSGLRSMKNYVTDNEGSWEVDIDALIEKYPDKAEALDIIENHAAIGDYVYHYFDIVDYGETDNENAMVYTEVLFDRKEALRVDKIVYSGDAGNRKLDSGRFAYMYSAVHKATEGLSGNQFIVPDWVRELGYDVGDKVTLTITPVRGSIPENSEQRKDTLEAIKKHNAECGEDDEYYLIKGEEVPEEASRYDWTSTNSLLGYMLSDHGIDGIELVNVQRAEPYTVEIEIAGFHDLRYINDDYSRTLEMYGGSGCIFDFCSHAEEFKENFPPRYSYNGVGCKIRTNDNYDFDECLMLILRDMGYSDDQYYEFFLDEALHSDLLMAEFKSAKAIGEVVPAIAIGLVILVLVWLLVRFIIDNAFEISVQERSVQFAQLRVMGASKAQIMAVVFTEAVFYTLTAVPIGTLLAFLCCRSVMGSFARAGIDYFVFAVNPVITIIGVLLCVIAIFISANTSALWATRKLSPAEALSFGKPKKQKQKKLRLKKSKTDKKRKSFIVRYTLKNIFRTKKRFFIATIAMTLSVMVFTICAFLGIYGYGEILPLMEGDKNHDFYYHDFYIHCESMDDFEEKSGILRSSDSIADVRYSMYIQSHSSLSTNENNSALISQMIPYEENAYTNMVLSVIQKEDYERYVEKLAGMSYEEFVASEGAMYLVNPYGNPMSFADEYGREPILRYEDYYKSASELGFSQEPLFKSTPKTNIKLMGSVCSEDIYYEFGCDGLLIPAEFAKELLESDRQNYYENVNLYIKVNGEKNYQAALELCEGLAGSSDLINTYYTGTGLRTYISAIVKLVLIFLLSIWLVGVLTMTNCVNTSVLNRQKELLMMRSVGMSRKQLAGTVILESVIFSAFSVIIGTVLGSLSFVILKLAMGYVNTPLFMGAAIGTVLISLLLNLIFAVLAALPGMDSLKKRMR